MNCGNCGNPLEPGATFCNKCGTPVSPIMQQAVESQQVPQQPKKKGGKVLLIIILLLVFLGAGIGLGYYLGKGNKPKCESEAKELAKPEEKKEEEKPAEEKKKDDDDPLGGKKSPALDVSSIKVNGGNDYGKNIEVLKMMMSKDNTYLYVLAKNNNNIDIDYTFYLDYLDNKGTRIDRGLELGYVEAGKTFVVKMYNSTADDIAGAGITIEAKQYKSYFHKVDVDKKKLTISETDKGVELSYKNDTQNDVSMYLSVIYYKDGEIIYYDHTTLTTVKPGLSGSTYFSKYNLPGYDYSKPDGKDYYDSYEVSIDCAYYYDDEY